MSKRSASNGGEGGIASPSTLRFVKPAAGSNPRLLNANFGDYVLKMAEKAGFEPAEPF